MTLAAGGQLGSSLHFSIPYLPSLTLWLAFLPSGAIPLLSLARAFLTSKWPPLSAKSSPFAITGALTWNTAEKNDDCYCLFWFFCILFHTSENGIWHIQTGNDFSALSTERCSLNNVMYHFVTLLFLLLLPVLIYSRHLLLVLSPIMLTVIA